MSAASGTRAATSQGLAALVIWASTVALSRSLSESVGALSGAAAALALGAALSVAVALARRQSLTAMLRLDRRYLFGCGALFVGYLAGLYAAIGLAPDQPTALLALLNYLWPALMVAFSVPILGVRARTPLLILGCALAFGGTAVAVAGDWSGRSELSWRSTLPLLLAAGAGVAWALYSNLARRFGPPRGDAVPLFLAASAVAVYLLLLAMPERSAWSPRAVAEMIALAVGPQAVAYSLWERGVRDGDHRLLGLASYFVPVASLAIASVYLGVLPGARLAMGCALIVAGALVSRRSLVSEPRGQSPS